MTEYHPNYSINILCIGDRTGFKVQNHAKENRNKAKLRVVEDSHLG